NEITHYSADRYLINIEPHRFERALVGLLFVHAHSVRTAYEHCAVWAALGDEFGIVETEIASKKQDDFASRRRRKSSGDVDDGGNGEFRSDGALCIVAPRRLLQPHSVVTIEHGPAGQVDVLARRYAAAVHRARDRGRSFAAGAETANHSKRLVDGSLGGR